MSRDSNPQPTWDRRQHENSGNNREEVASTFKIGATYEFDIGWHGRTFFKNEIQSVREYRRIASGEDATISSTQLKNPACAPANARPNVKGSWGGQSCIRVGRASSSTLIPA